MSFKIYFAGAEVSTWRKLLASCEVEHVAISYLHLRPKISMNRSWRLGEHFPEGQEIFVDSGSFGINRKTWSNTEHEQYLAEYLEFVQANLDRLSYFTECDFTGMGRDWVEGRRQDTWAGLAPDKFVPVWHPEHGLEALRGLLGVYSNVGVPTLPKDAHNALTPLVRTSRTKLHGLSFDHPIAPRSIYSTIVSSSWISPSRYGETVVWDHNRLRRYPSADKQRARRRHQGQFKAAGFNAAGILADDKAELLRYTIWAWQQAEAHQEGPRRVRYIPRPPSPVTPEVNGHVPRPRLPDLGPVVGEPIVLRPSGSLLPGVVRPIPVFDFAPVTSQIPDPQGGPGMVEVTTPVASMGHQTIRQCDSCSLAGICPEYAPGQACKYSIPVEIRTRPQLMGILYSLLEMQTQRVAFGFFSEQLQGGYPDANLSSELDRMMRMTQSVKDIQDNRDFLKVTVEGKAQAGVLRQLFGGDRTDQLHRVDGARAEDAVRRAMKP